jgi:hypothetical protein
MDPADIPRPAPSIGGLVRNAVGICLCLALFAAIGGAAQKRGEGAAPGEQYLGTWSGTWEGAGGAGGIELIFEKAKDGSIGARVSVTGEPTYKAAFESVSFEASKFTGKYSFPPDENIRVTFVGTLEGNTAKGTWSANEKAGGGEVAAGTWTTTKK